MQFNGISRTSVLLDHLSLTSRQENEETVWIQFCLLEDEYYYDMSFYQFTDFVTRYLCPIVTVVRYIINELCRIISVRNLNTSIQLN